HRLLVTARSRAATRLHDGLAAPLPEDPDIDALVDVSGAPSRATPVLIAGGEPTLRADLPELAARLRGPGLITDALALAKPTAAAPLFEAGVRRFRATLHAARPDAHDWLVMQPGAARLAVRALRTLRALGATTEIAAVLTRP